MNVEHIRKCGNCAHFEACDNIIKRYAGFSGIEKEVQACGHYAYRLEDILGDDYDLDRLRELVQAEREKRCFTCPVTVGQKVWFVRDLKRHPENIVETCVEKIIHKRTGIYMKLACNSMYETACSSIGKTVFLTREAAAALKGETNK